jgi:SAM-dependent methyltransferase
VNDGKSLPFLDDDSIDFVFSWDSLVHANDEAISSYLKDLSRILKPGGHGFIHHSNMATYVDPNSDTLTIENRHWRDTSMTAKRFRELCVACGMKCISQEIVEWEPGVLSDAFSLFTRQEGTAVEDTKVFENFDFLKEVENVRNMYAHIHPPAL